jgi:hypothetical protein
MSGKFVTCDFVQDEIQLKFNYNKEIIEIVKKLPGRRFITAEKVWSICAKSKPQMENMFNSHGIKFQYTKTILKVI